MIFEATGAHGRRNQNLEQPYLRNWKRRASFLQGVTLINA